MFSLGFFFYFIPNSEYHDFLRKILLIYEKHPPFACIYTKSFALIRESYAFIRESFALIRESYALIRETYKFFLYKNEPNRLS